MCIAILNKSNQLSRKTLKNCWDSNDDGGGIMFVRDGVLNVFKQPNTSPTDFDALYLAYATAFRHRDKHTPIVLHFRIATHGMTPDFLHPFLVTDTLGFVHNGILAGLGTHEYSDTAFLRDMLRELPTPMTGNVQGLVGPQIMLMMLHKFIGAGNKLIFLDNTGDFEIINEEAGIWDDGNWFSNSSYKERGVRYYGSYAMYDYDKPWADGAYGAKPTAKVSSKSQAYYDDLDLLEEDEWNKSFDAQDKTILVEVENLSPLIEAHEVIDVKAHCSSCAKDTYVTMYAECSECGAYNLKAESAVIAWQDSNGLVL